MTKFTLKRVYAPSRVLLPDLLGDLSRARQGADEKVVDYGLRISRKLRAASDNIRENLVPDLVPRALENVAIFALASFTRGLRKDVEERVERQGPKFLETAIDLAIAAEAKIADRAIFDNESAKTFQRVRIINPSNQPPRLCYNCNKPGHLRRDYKADCQGIICHRCRKEGHIAVYCRDYAQENLNENAGRQVNATTARPNQTAFKTESSWRSTHPTPYSYP
uniref:CCHC-type domain-containing protein n=1 Tax=Trichogramma kaykai TaxID=54128 RepID=A0ABD2W955_9HYME